MKTIKLSAVKGDEKVYPFSHPITIKELNQNNDWACGTRDFYTEKSIRQFLNDGSHRYIKRGKKWMEVIL